MSDAGSHHEDHDRKLFRISALKDFLPLSEDNSLSTRGAHLPALMVSSPVGSSKSSSNIAGMKGWQARRRRSSLGDGDIPRRRSTESERRKLHGEAQGQLDAALDPETARRWSAVAGWGGGDEADERRMNMAASVLMAPQVRSQRLIGNSNPRYKWERYWKTEEELGKMPKKTRGYVTLDWDIAPSNFVEAPLLTSLRYYERNNYLIQHYMYIDRLLDSSLPHHLIQEYHSTNPPIGSSFSPPDVPATISEEPTPSPSPLISGQTPSSGSLDATAVANGNANGGVPKVKRTPKDIYRHKESTHDAGSDESTPLLKTSSRGDEEAQAMPPDLEVEEEASSSSRIVTIAIWINFIANFVLLIMKIVVAAMTSSVSVLASLVDAALDFLSTAIIWTSKYLIENTDQYGYPVGKSILTAHRRYGVVSCRAHMPSNPTKETC